MALTQHIYSIGTATTTVVEPTPDYVEYVLKNLEPQGADNLARDGHVYMVGQKFSVASGSSVSFSIETGVTGAQFEFYQIITDASSIYANLIEGATVVTNGSNIPAYNLNRNFPDTYNAVLKSATSVTGGTIISSEFVTASVHAGGAAASVKVHTLEPNTQYAMKFTNQGNQSTNVFFQLGFAEQYNGYSEIWLGTVDDSFVLKPGQELKMTLQPNAVINATAKDGACKLAVMRQE